MTALFFLTDTSAAPGTDVWHRCAHLQAHRAWCVQLRDKGSWVTRTAIPAVPREPNNSSSDCCMFLPLSGALRHWQLCFPHSFCQLDCVFIVTSALSLLLPGHQSHCTPPGRKSRDFWSTYYVCKGLLNPNSPHVCTHPFVFFSLFFPLFSFTKQGESVFPIMHCLEMQLKVVYTIVLPPYIITGWPGSKYFLASFIPKYSFDQ